MLSIEKSEIWDPIYRLYFYYIYIYIYIRIFFSFAILYVELEDHTQTFINFIEALTDNNTQEIDCENIFWKCTTDDDVFVSLHNN